MQVLPSSNAFFEGMDAWSMEGKSFYFFIDYTGENAWMGSPEQALEQGLRFAFHTQAPDCPKAVILKKQPLDAEAYKIKFAKVREALQRGDTFLCNLTAPTPIQSNLSLEEIFHYAQAPYKLWIPNQLLVFSPEAFIRIQGNQIQSFPMKGTEKVKAQEGSGLIFDQKEKAEHATIVDLIRNDLSQVAFPVQVPRFQYMERVPTQEGALWQMSSEIQGALMPAFQGKIGSILKKLLPAGSITGAPKPATQALIASVEAYDRGFYTGIMGYFDGKNLDSAVMIRFIEQAKNGALAFKSGGGITFQSQWEKEYQELVDKVYLPIPQAQLLESISLKDGEIQQLEFHQERVNRSFAAMYPQARPMVLEEILAKENLPSQGWYRIRVLYRSALEAVQVLPYTWKQVQTLALADIGDWAYPYKFANRQFLERVLQEHPGADECLLVQDGRVKDACTANLAFYKNGEWFTPIHCLLPGTKRAQLLAQGKIQERDIFLEDLREYSHLALINAFRDLDPQHALSLSTALM